MKTKYYVVWEGREPGVYTDWDDAFEQVDGYPGARYKSFTNHEAAIEAFRGSPTEESKFLRLAANHAASMPGAPHDYTLIPEIRLDAIAVDGACSKNPGPMEYRCVRVIDGVEIFRKGPFAGGTNNIGEYLAIIHAAALLAARGDTTTPIYSDSMTAQAWVRRRHSNTKIQPTPENAQLRQLLERADSWIATHTIPNPLLKWDTERWGEIPADFGRK
ncbi:MAG: ribonuclease H family protein [Odoribacter sp.]|nr:ribonuclease H family protein [Odoribacter sp.]